MEQPDFIAYRIKLWDEYKQKQQQEKKASETPIKITLPDGKIIDGVAGVTTPLSIAEKISKKLRDSTVVAKVNGELVDAWIPLEKDCALELITFDKPEAKDVFHHSSAHILGEALEQKYGCMLCVGPPLEGNIDHFYYEARMANPEDK